eukprot:gene21809-26737_t
MGAVHKGSAGLLRGQQRLPAGRARPGRGELQPPRGAEGGGMNWLDQSYRIVLMCGDVDVGAVYPPSGRAKVWRWRVWVTKSGHPRLPGWSRKAVRYEHGSTINHSGLAGHRPAAQGAGSAGALRSRAAYQQQARLVPSQSGQD